MGSLRRPGPPDERLRREQRLRRRSEFLRCYREGRKLRGALCTVHFLRRPPDGRAAECSGAERSDADRRARLGITASRKVGKSALRHLLKRRVREVFRRFPQRAELDAHDIVVHLWPAARNASFAGLRTELQTSLRSIARRA